MELERRRGKKGRKRGEEAGLAIGSGRERKRKLKKLRKGGRIKEGRGKKKERGAKREEGREKTRREERLAWNESDINMRGDKVRWRGRGNKERCGKMENEGGGGGVGSITRDEEKGSLIS